MENAQGYLLPHVNDAFTVVNRVLSAGGDARWITEPLDAEGVSFASGAFYVETDLERAGAMAEELGMDFVGIGEQPGSAAMELRPVKVGLADRYGGSMPSGWTRMILEDFDFDFDVVFAPDLEDNLSSYDVIVLEDGAISRGGGGGFGGGGPDPEDIPEEYRGRLGRITETTTVPKILEFVRGGGTVIAIGSSATIALDAGLPLTNHLVDADGRPLPRETYFTPGSVLDMKVEAVSPLAHGFGERVNVLFSHSPTFALADDAEAAAGVRAVGWFDSANPLKSGWSWGGHHLEGGIGIIEADYGAGKIFIFGPKITFRAQSHGTFGFLFNAIYYGSAR